MPDFTFIFCLLPLHTHQHNCMLAKVPLKRTLVQSSVGLTESHMREALSCDHKVISYFFHCLGIEPDLKKKRLLRKWLSMRETWSDL